MDYAALIIVLILFLLVLSAALTVGRVVIFEYQRGLLYRRGRFAGILNPGDHFFFRPFHSIRTVDVRTFSITIPGQEVLSADNVSLKVSLAASYRVSDPYLALNKVASYPEALYMILQLNLRDIIGSLAVDDILVKRDEIGTQLTEKSKPQAAEIGIELSFANLKDVMFPGELKNIFAQVVNARKEGLAALERARGESAALRSLANASSVFENNPNLLQLRTLQMLEKSTGNTVVLMPPKRDRGGKVLPPKLADKNPSKK